MDGLLGNVTLNCTLSITSMTSLLTYMYWLGNCYLSAHAKESAVYLLDLDSTEIKTSINKLWCKRIVCLHIYFLGFCNFWTCSIGCSASFSFSLILITWLTFWSSDFVIYGDLISPLAWVRVSLLPPIHRFHWPCERRHHQQNLQTLVDATSHVPKPRTN